MPSAVDQELLVPLVMCFVVQSFLMTCC